MKKFLTGLFAAGLLLSAAPALQAAQGVRAERTTFYELAVHADLIVKAKLVEIVDVELEDGVANLDVQLHRFNNSNEAIRRDARLQVTEVLRGDGVFVGELDIVSVQQQSFTQYPASLQAGKEALFFLEKRSDGLWDLGGAQRGILSEESGVGSFTRVEKAVRDVLSYEHQYVLNEGARHGALQERFMKEVKLDDSRLSIDSLLDLSMNAETYAPYFDSYERFELVNLLWDSVAGSAERLELITLIGRVQPDGGREAIIEAIIADPSERTAARGADALEQYGTAKSCEMLLDRYLEIEAGEDISKARVITALGILRPYNKHADEQMVRARVTDLLRSVLNRDSNSLVLQEALLAARDMRYTNNELGPQLTQLVEDFRQGLVSDVVYKRVIVALAATRNAQAKEQLLALKGEFNTRYDKHIELSILMPFTTLVDFK